MQRGDEVKIDPRAGATASGLASYVRLSEVDAPIRLDGNTRWAPFSAFLLPAARYDLLIVPEDGAAPLYFPARTAHEINILSPQVDPGAAVTGRLLDPAGAPVRDGRVVLRAGALTSTVGASDVDGNFALRARPETYALVVSPPPDAGLPELQVPVASGLAVSADAAVEVRWAGAAAARLQVLVSGADGATAAGARVQLQMDAIAQAGSLAAGKAKLAAEGRLDLVALAGSDGAVTFPRLPRARYRVTVAPPDSDSVSAVADAVVDLSGGDSSRSINLGRRVPLRGRLFPAGDAAGMRVVAALAATDPLRPLRPSVSSTVGPDGTYEVPVDPGRDYLVWLEPPAGSRMPRVVVGRVPASAAGGAAPDHTLARGLTVDALLTVDAKLAEVPGALLQVLCIPDAPDCFDATVPLAEAVSGTGGRAQLVLPDPGRP
jgi:hypothetical protein